MKDFFRVWQELDLEDVEKHLIVAGELSAECFSCHSVGVDLNAVVCPECGVTFKYMGFRRKDPVNYIRRKKEDLPRITFIDFDDFRRVVGKRDAGKMLDF